MENQPKPFFQKIVGRDPEYRESLTGHLTKQFREQHLGSSQTKELLSREIQKTNEHYKIIQAVNIATNELLAECGMEPHEVPPANIHLVETSDSVENVDAGFAPQGQMIIFGERAHKENIVFASSLLHEAIHAKGYNALRIGEDESGTPNALNIHGSGMQMGSKDGTRVFLQNFDEALTELITIKLLPKVLADPSLSAEAKKQEAIKEKIRSVLGSSEELEDSYFFILNESGALTDYEPHAYPTQRKTVTLLIEKILASNTSPFTTAEEIEKFFIKSKMNGHLVELANVTDKAFGEGTFRKMAEADIDNHDPEPFKAFIEAL